MGKYGWLISIQPKVLSRPVLILQNQTLLDIKHPSTLIIPLTTQLIENAEPLRFRILAQDNLEKDSDLLIDQLIAIDNRRLLKGPLMQCSPSVMQYIYDLVRDVLGISY